MWRGVPLGDLAGQVALVNLQRRLVDLRLEILEALTDLDLSAGRHAVAVVRADEALFEAPHRERSWEQLMLGLYRSGRQSDALAAFQRCRRLLRDELGIGPNQRLVALDGDILRQAPELEWSPTTDRRAIGAALACVEPARRLDEAFVGRHHELDRMVSWWADVQRAAARVLLIEGLAGAGKSRLASELRDRLVADGTVVLVAV